MLQVLQLTPWHSDILLQFTADAGIHFIHACCKARWNFYFIGLYSILNYFRALSGFFLRAFTDFF